MKNPVVTEYEIIKQLREIQLIKRLCKLQVELFGSHVMIPELLDVLQPEDKDADFNVCMVMEYI